MPDMGLLLTAFKHKPTFIYSTSVPSIKVSSMNCGLDVMLATVGFTTNVLDLKKLLYLRNHTDLYVIYASKLLLSPILCMIFNPKLMKNMSILQIRCSKFELASDQTSLFHHSAEI